MYFERKVPQKILRPYKNPVQLTLTERLNLFIGFTSCLLPSASSLTGYLGVPALKNFDFLMTLYLDTSVL
ncbi:hypothetical protein [Nostoc sp. LPT]|uniref:hypothetical protein n=1 Tax=Nostoc sp. LPT TaxID=2815387 RepID=UPI0025F85699|nr:hypothetical protein [Nostoc sp. LPT]